MHVHLPAIHVSESLYRETGFFLSTSRRLLRRASAVLFGGGASVLALGSLRRCFDEHERAARVSEYDAIERGRWSPQKRKTADGITYVTCDVTTGVHHYEDNRVTTHLGILQHQVLLQCVF